MSTKPKTLLQRLSAGIFQLAGWRVDGDFPPLRKCVIVGAPHTTNWDFILMLLIAGYFDLRLRWAGKDSLFQPPFGWLMRKLGGIPVNRRARTRLVDQIIAAFDEREDMILVITPEGTRSKSRYWKSGFYYIAVGAKVPLVLASPDFPTKTIAIGTHFLPSGDIEADFELIRQYFTGRRGKYPDKQGEIRLQPPPGELEAQSMQTPSPN